MRESAFIEFFFNRNARNPLGNLTKNARRRRALLGAFAESIYSWAQKAWVSMLETVFPTAEIFRISGMP